MKQLPLQKAFTLIEPGPVLLISTADKGKNNLMTLSWSMVIDFTPRFAFTTGPWNFSYNALLKTKQCVIAVPTAQLGAAIVKIGDCSGADTDKFKKFKLTPLPAAQVKAPLVKECYANIECRVIDHIKKHDIFILEAVAAWINPAIKDTRLLHAVGDGTFTIDGPKRNYRKFMKDKLPDGV